MVIDLAPSFEIGPIRPPSEAYSLLLRVTRNCPWNKCIFCHTYKGQKFELRTVDEVKKDIDTARRIYEDLQIIARRYDGDIKKAAIFILNNPPNESYYNVALWQYAGGENVFLQDANSLILPTDDLEEILKYLKATFPGIKRITSYARSHTASRKTVDELRRLHEAGLSRLHLGLESGYDALLQYMNKGVTAAQHIQGGKNVVASGISLCEYVLLGLGGKTMWREHALETARVLNEINPDYVRVRTLTVKKPMPLWDEVQKGNFVQSSDEEIIREERLLLENLTCTSNFVSDHTTNLLQELEGKLPDDKEKFLAVIDRYLSLPPEKKKHFEVGRRTCIYETLDDLNNPFKRQQVDDFIRRITHNGGEVNDKIIRRLMEAFI